jgi:hypothetical protein
MIFLFGQLVFSADCGSLLLTANELFAVHEARLEPSGL